VGLPSFTGAMFKTGNPNEILAPPAFDSIFICPSIWRTRPRIPPDAYAGALGLNLSQHFRRYSLPFVLDLQRNTLTLARNTNHAAFASTVAMNARQAFLHEPQHDQLHLGGKPSEIVRNA
jgi:hypothetical protein